MISFQTMFGELPPDTAASSANPNSAACSPTPTTSAVHKLTALEREEAIRHAGRLIEKHMAEWERSGCFAARGKAIYAQQCMERLIKGRSPEQVASMERAAGLM